MFRNVLVLSASAGAGHLRAADAVTKAFEETGAARTVRHIDILQHTSSVFRKLYSRAYVKMVNRLPKLMGWLYDWSDKPWRMQRRRLAFDKLNAQPLIKLLKEISPDLIVCTHFTPAEIVSYLKRKRHLDSMHAVVVTDMDVHGMWLCRDVDHYFVMLEETRQHLIKLGIAAESITVSGIPIDPVFTKRKSKARMRSKHGLRPEVTTILISAGGFGVGPIEKLLKSLLDLRHPAQLVAICGRSATLRKRVEKFAAEIPQGHHVSVKAVGFTTEMDEFMTAADILMGKPGGLTTCEALAKGLVIAVVRPIPGQEERNADHLLEEGAAIRCNNFPVVAYKIDRLLDDPKRFARMKRSVRLLAKPRAAFTIVEKLLSLTKT